MKKILLLNLLLLSSFALRAMNEVEDKFCVISKRLVLLGQINSDAYTDLFDLCEKPGAIIDIDSSSLAVLRALNFIDVNNAVIDLKDVYSILNSSNVEKSNESYA